jgi:hypothetical protein
MRRRTELLAPARFALAFARELDTTGAADDLYIGRVEFTAAGAVTPGNVTRQPEDLPNSP